MSSLAGQITLLLATYSKCLKLLKKYGKAGLSKKLNSGKGKKSASSSSTETKTKKEKQTDEKSGLGLSLRSLRNSIGDDRDAIKERYAQALSSTLHASRVKKGDHKVRISIQNITAKMRSVNTAIAKSLRDLESGSKVLKFRKTSAVSKSSRYNAITALELFLERLDKKKKPPSRLKSNKNRAPDSAQALELGTGTPDIPGAAGKQENVPKTSTGKKLRTVVINTKRLSIMTFSSASTKVGEVSQKKYRQIMAARHRKGEDLGNYGVKPVYPQAETAALKANKLKKDQRQPQSWKKWLWKPRAPS